MKNGILIFLLLFPILNDMSAQVLYKEYPVYKGKDLGLIYTDKYSLFRIWSPPAEEAQLLLYKEGEKGAPFKILSFEKGTQGTWYKKLTGNWKGTFYTIRVKINKVWNEEVVDPYARAVGINGRRGLVIDLKETNPAGWAADLSPVFSKNNRATDAIIYELHIRDASMDSSSGIRQKGKFLGLTEIKTHTESGYLTGLSHLKELGITHLHLLPFFDFSSIDESKTSPPQYNWGYDPLNYNVPEGSYSTNPYDGITRIKELKELVSAIHRQGLGIIMDVVYNHTATNFTSNFNQLVPGYYYRHKLNGDFSDATGCGNETASERPMMRKFMLESILYWAREYHIDGFRFDLMGVHDIQTMNLISDSLHRIRPDIILYGEGWTAGDSPLPDSLRALKKNVSKLRGIAVFSDDIRDGIKGSVFDKADKGFVSGKTENKESVLFGIVAACRHSQIDYKMINYSKKPYAGNPANTITYCECHDNNTLWDKLALSCPQTDSMERKKMQELALTIILTSQGIPFLHAGTEFLRSKKGVENSYNAGDSINAIKWSLKKENIALTKYIEFLIKMRKNHPAFRMWTTSQVEKNIRFAEHTPAGLIVYTINGKAMKDRWQKIWISFNGTGSSQEVSLPKGRWKTLVNSGEIKNSYILNSPIISIKAYSATILYQ
jgi:pullulanase